MTTYTFTVTQDQREAIYAGACHAVAHRGHRDLADLMNITRDVEPTLTLSDVQIAAVLSGLVGAIEAQSTDQGDWLRAKDYMAARDYLVASTRKQFRAVK